MVMMVMIPLCSWMLASPWRGRCPGVQHSKVRCNEPERIDLVAYTSIAYEKSRDGEGQWTILYLTNKFKPTGALCVVCE